MAAVSAGDFDERARLMAFRGPWDEKEWGSYHKDAERLFTARDEQLTAEFSVSSSLAAKLLAAEALLKERSDRL